MPYQFDVEQRAPYSPNPSGWYHWTNSYIINAANDSQAFDFIGDIDQAARNLLAKPGRQVRMTLKRTPGMGGVYQSIGLSNEAGARPESPNGYNLLLYLKVVLYVGEEAVGYKRVRLPWSQEHFTGDLWTPTAMAAARAPFLTLIGNGVLAARDGRVITNALSDPFVRQWQLRDGTKRRQRPVLA